MRHRIRLEVGPGFPGSAPWQRAICDRCGFRMSMGSVTVDAAQELVDRTLVSCDEELARRVLES